MEDGQETNGTTDSGHPRHGGDYTGPIEAVKQVALAGLGAVAVATEAADEMFHALVHKGEEAREDALREIREAKTRSAQRRADSETFLRSTMDDLLNRVSVASKGDIEALNAKLNIISRKLDEVHMGRDATPASGVGFTESVSESPVTPETPTDPGPL